MWTLRCSTRWLLSARDRPLMVLLVIVSWNAGPPIVVRPIPVKDGGGHVVGHGVHSFQQHRALTGWRRQAIRSRVRTDPLKAAFVGGDPFLLSGRHIPHVMTTIWRAKRCKRWSPHQSGGAPLCLLRAGQHPGPTPPARLRWKEKTLAWRLPESPFFERCCHGHADLIVKIAHRM